SYIEEVAARYISKLHSWDVVNEPFWPGHKAPGGYRLGPWYDTFGTGYVRRAFERVAMVDRKTKLVLNEAQSERDDEVGLTVRKGLLQLVDELKHAGVPLHAVGLQSHLQPRYPHDPGRFVEFGQVDIDATIGERMKEFGKASGVVRVARLQVALQSDGMQRHAGMLQLVHQLQQSLAYREADLIVAF